MILTPLGQGPRAVIHGSWDLIKLTAESWRRRMEGSEFSTVRDLAIAVNLAERHVSRQLRLAYLAPAVLKRLVYKRKVPAITAKQLADCALLSWQDQEGVAFGEDSGAK